MKDYERTRPTFFWSTVYLKDFLLFLVLPVPDSSICSSVIKYLLIHLCVYTVAFVPYSNSVIAEMLTDQITCSTDYQCMNLHAFYSRKKNEFVSFVFEYNYPDFLMGLFGINRDKRHVSWSKVYLCLPFLFVA